MSEPNPSPPPRRRGNPAMVAGAPSLNPRGRPRRGESLAERVRELVDLDAIVEFLDEAMRDPGNKLEVRLAAAAQLLDRGWGKPDQSVSIDARVAARATPALPGDWSTLGRAERAAWLAANLPGALPLHGEGNG